MESNSSSKRLQAAPPISTYLSLYSLKYSFQRSSLMLRQLHRRTFIRFSRHGNRNTITYNFHIMKTVTFGKRKWKFTDCSFLCWKYIYVISNQIIKIIRCLFDTIFHLANYITYNIMCKRIYNYIKMSI